MLRQPYTMSGTEVRDATTRNGAPLLGENGEPAQVQVSPFASPTPSPLLTYASHILCLLLSYVMSATAQIHESRAMPATALRESYAASSTGRAHLSPSGLPDAWY